MKAMPAWLQPAWQHPRIRGGSIERGADAGASGLDGFNLGTRCGDAAPRVQAHRALLRTALPAEPLWLEQCHGVTVYDGDRAPAPGVEPRADAATTRTPGVVLAVLTADCLPLLLAARDGSEVAAVHAGWRGLCAGIVEATCARMRTPPAQLQAWLGPAISATAYEVGAAVRDAFLIEDAAAATAFVPGRPGHWYCDLYALARQRLRALGVDRIAGGERCTHAEPAHFYSHRRDPRSGRMASLVWMV